MYYIYQIRNIINNKIYVGVHQSNNIKNDQYMGSGKYLKNAIMKYGIENFERNILYEFEQKNDAYIKEKMIVNQEFVERNDTYNIKIGGFGGFPKNLWLGRHHSEQTKIKCSLINKGRIFSQQTLKKMSLSKMGKSTWNKGLSLSQTHKESISKNRCGKCVGSSNPFYGKTHTQQTLEKLRKPKSKQHIQKIKESRAKNYPNHSQQTKSKIRESLKEHYQKKRLAL